MTQRGQGAEFLRQREPNTAVVSLRCREAKSSWLLLIVTRFRAMVSLVMRSVVR